MVRASDNFSNVTFIEVDSCHRMRGTIANVVLRDVDIKFQDHISETLDSQKR